MTAQRTPSKLVRAAGLAVYSLVLLAASFARGASAQEVRLESAGQSAPAGLGASAAVAAPLTGGGLSGSAPALLSAPSFSLNGAPAALTAPSVAIGARETSALPALAPAAAPLSPALAFKAAAAKLAAPFDGNEADHAGMKALSPAAAPIASAAPALTAAEHVTALKRLADAPAAAGTEASAEAAPETAEGGAARAESDFAALTGERLIQSENGATNAPAEFEPAASPKAAALRSSRPGVRALSAVSGVAALGLAPGLHALLQASPATWHVLSQTGYIVGNAGAAIFPLVQIYETFKGKTTPKGRAIVGALASLALGLVSAPILHKSLWGVQNIFGGITLLAPMLIGAWARRVRGSGLKETALITAGALAVSAGLYFAVAAALPGALAAVLSAAAISKIAMAVQFATSALFLWMFLPDFFHLLRGKAAHGFSTGFNLMFFVSAVGSMVWALPSAFIFSDAHRGSYQLIFAINAVYALTSFLSFWFARREAKPQ